MDVCFAVSAKELFAAQLFPAGIIVYAEVTDPPQLLGIILDYPLCAKVEALPLYRETLESDDFRNFSTPPDANWWNSSWESTAEKPSKPLRHEASPWALM